MNFCSCLDFKTDQLGSCKHIEFVLANIIRSPRKNKVLKQGWQPHYTSIYLQYGNDRKVKIRIGSGRQKEFLQLSEKYFDAQQVLKETCFSTFDIFLQQAKIRRWFLANGDA